MGSHSRKAKLEGRNVAWGGLNVDVKDEDDARRIKWEADMLIGFFFLISLGYALYVANIVLAK
jgi:hypothetical protein